MEGFLLLLHASRADSNLMHDFGGKEELDTGPMSDYPDPAGEAAEIPDITDRGTSSLDPKPELPVPERYTIESPPNSIEESESVQSWQELFKTRSAWALRVVEDCRKMAAVVEDGYGEMDVMVCCLDAAVRNLEASIKGHEAKYSELQKWFPETQADYGALAAGWEQYLSLARSIPVSPRHVQVADLDKAASRLFQGAQDLFREYEGTYGRYVVPHAGEPQQLVHDIEALAQKICTDYETTLSYAGPTRDAVVQASKIAANHTQRLLPSVSQRAVEMHDMLRSVTQARNSLATESLDFMRGITNITALSQSVKSQFSVVNQEEDFATFDYLRLIQQVPYMYASFVAEAIKRREWYDKMKQDSSTLANEMALFQEEEVKRRRRWYKTMGPAYGPELLRSDSNVPGLEVNLLGEEERWPAMTWKDLEDFQALLQTKQADAGIIEDVGKMVSELGNPTRQQSKRMKAFKNGSVHDAALGRSGLLIRGDDDLLRSLQDDKSKLESKLKTAESRVRRLEDLLHRQTQVSRPSLGNLFQIPSHQLYDRADSSISLKSPHASDGRRGSAEGTDILTQRVQQLEAELRTEKERSAALEKDLGGQVALYSDVQGRMDEVNSTKKDLLENMEALKREFMEERKSLEDEIKRLQARLEDTEDEIENFGESRENEKASYDETIQALKLEIERLMKEKRDEALKSEAKISFLHEEARLQSERIETQERKTQVAQNESNNSRKKLEEFNKAADVQLKALPSDAVAKMQSLEGDISLLRSELDSAQSAIKAARVEKEALTERVSNEEISSIRLRESLAEEKAKVLALEGELCDGREQLRQLRTEIADGETGSESLRKRLEEEEKKITAVTEELASRSSQVGSLEEEVLHYKDKLQRSQAELSSLTAFFDTRSEHAKDLTQRLYSHNERLIHLLERLGFSVTRQGGSMAIQKVSRSERIVPTWTSSAKQRLCIGAFEMLSTWSRKLQRDARAYRDKARALQKEAHEKIAFKNFKEGDLALFLPTRNQTTGAWAAFNVGFPHYFLREQEAHRLRNREWLLARISRVQDRVVDLSKSLQTPPGSAKKGGATESESPYDDENDNPFDLSDGLRWYLLDAAEDKPGAPSTPGLAKSTVAANNVEAMADRHTHGRGGSKGGVTGNRGSAASGIEGVSKTLSKSLESRRSSTGSRKALPFAIGVSRGRDSAVASETNSLRAVRADTPVPASPTQQHGTASGVAQHDSPLASSHTTETTRVMGVGGRLTDAEPRQQPEVRSDMDSLMGP
ncbi:hypothetical protein CHGG_02720 [Chaetomium globosum CBS 148.51]|uniref:Autophagy-related protein 11 n=1 Tax=Chaetomium globosum (strain ATCC 6205 / CBS 148.51 / DSM 1962 / NBRC 6347 / NRRL 1970) TaxID=306901 RepID=Q2HAN4_CHAGB|nr:uncharacterized protein CHGG_02720 [Chaetomium globosum CBS 148.51]EAQ90785.1 hypothetical protein CHGG_02720 [Chaetomium globosum CBS 148.51]